MHSFKEKLAQGESAAEEIDLILLRNYPGIQINYMPLAVDKIGIDRLLLFPDGQRSTAEYKTDIRAGETGCFYIETVSVERDARVIQRGWIYTCCAQLMLIYVPTVGRLFMVETLQLRRCFLSHIGRLRKVEAKNKDYIGRGVLLPLEELRELNLLGG